jgi:ATP-dependent Clp protease adaptor protein ClpS
VFWNDKRTTMEFVVELLRGTFGVVEPHATRLMLTTDREGFGVVGTYEREEAERLAETAMRLARERGFPLRVSVEEAGHMTAMGLVARWLHRRSARANVRLVARQLPRIPRASQSAAPWTVLDEALECPCCGVASTRYRKLADALVCAGCGRSFTYASTEPACGEATE